VSFRASNLMMIAALFALLCVVHTASADPPGATAGLPSSAGQQDLKPSLTVDVRKTGEPVSKYIYGQFIEHLGRCIYGGIWAEMLEDRKFYFPVTPKYDPYNVPRDKPGEVYLPVVKASPWQIVGPDDSVQMVKEDSFVGEQTPLITPGGGIRQNDLGLIKGKQYVGYVWLKAAGEPTSVEVTLRWGDGAREKVSKVISSTPGDYQKHPLDFTAGADTDQASLEIKVLSGGPCLVGTASLMPSDNVEGMRADTLGLLKQLDATVYRWPGGNFVSGYDWKDGIGDRDRRPPRKNPAWTGVEHNDFGIDEFMTFCRVLGTEPLAVVNSGLGNCKSAVEEVQYANGAADTPMGKLRAKNGHAEPYKVKWWGIGNEMYGNWQLGHMPLADYIRKHNEYAEAMRAEDPSIKLIAVGAVGTWSEQMMAHCAEHMDLVSEHFYRGGKPELVAHVKQAPDAIRSIAAAHRGYRRQLDSLRGKDIRIALDEWNYWYGPQLYGEVGTRYFLKDALAIAAGLNEYVRNSDIYLMANYAQTVNVLGCIKTDRTSAVFDATALPLMLYRRHFGTLPVAVTAEAPLDVAAALTPDRKTLTVAVVNPTMRKLDLPLKVEGAKLKGSGIRWQIAGNDLMAYNQPGKPPKVSIEEAPLNNVAQTLSVVPCSVTLFALEME
jgi:alpha-N-arabinofuranosidase